MSKTCQCKNNNDSAKKDFKKTVKKALEALNKKNFAMIIHGASFPSKKGQDVGFGSYNSEGAREFIEFVEDMGFNALQLGPDGKTKAVDASPYIGTMFSNNPLFIDLYQLTTDDFDKILSKETFERIVNENPANNYRTAYQYVYNVHHKALREAFKNWEPDKKFKKFVEENATWLEKDAIYEALSMKHGNDYWPIWKDELDKKLFCAGVTAEDRLKEIKKNYAGEIEFYQFVQYIAHRQKQNTQKFLKKSKITTIADCQVAFSDRDYWANQCHFLSGYYLGCPPDIFSDDGQAWGFPVMDPDQLFNADGTLGEGGKILKARFDKMFEENPGGVRIDHIIGLIDPFVYKEGTMPKPEFGASRLYSSPEHEELKKYAIPGVENLNPEVGPENEKRIIGLSQEQVKHYAAILERIVIKSAEEKVIDKESIICEDLGTITNPVVQVMKYLDLSGLRVTEFVDPAEEEDPYRVKNTEPQHWVMVGSHDNPPITAWVDELYQKGEISQHAAILAGDLGLNAQELVDNRSKFITAKFAELFASPAENVQVFFADFFGMNERYNMPGTAGNQNWSLRVPNNYECYYNNQLEQGNAMNLPAALLMAMRSKGEKFVAEHQELIEKLEKLV